MYKVDSDLYDVAMKTINIDDVKQVDKLFFSIYRTFKDDDVLGVLKTAAALFKLGYMQGIRAEWKRRKSA